MDLLEFFGNPAASRTEEIDFRGRQITLRALTAFETERVQGIFTRPRAPYAREPGTHPTSGPMFVNEQHPEYLKEMEAWLRKTRLLEVAAAIGVGVPVAGIVGAAPGDMVRFNLTLPGNVLVSWAAAVIAANTLSDSEIVWLWHRARDIADPYGAGGDRVEAAKKALSALSPEARTELLRSFQTGTASPPGT